MIGLKEIMKKMYVLQEVLPFDAIMFCAVTTQVGYVDHANDQWVKLR